MRYTSVIPSSRPPFTQANNFVTTSVAKKFFEQAFKRMLSAFKMLLTTYVYSILLTFENDSGSIFCSLTMVLRIQSTTDAANGSAISAVLAWLDKKYDIIAW